MKTWFPDQFSPEEYPGLSLSIQHYLVVLGRLSAAGEAIAMIAREQTGMALIRMTGR
jgi:hypothetical protein